MKNEIQVFNHEQFGSIRTMTMPDGQVGFVGKDVAMVLGYERPDNAIRNHVNDDDKLMHQISASGQRRNVWFINESGLYSLILHAFDLCVQNAGLKTEEMDIWGEHNWHSNLMAVLSVELPKLMSNEQLLGGVAKRLPNHFWTRCHRCSPGNSSRICVYGKGRAPR